METCWVFIKWYDNRPLPSSKNPHFQNEAKCTAFLVKMSFICMRMKNYFHIKGWALNLVLIQRPGRTWKWSITLGREMKIPNGKPLKALWCVFLVKKKKKKAKERKLTYTDLTFVLFILEETLCVVTVGVPLMKTSLAVSWQVISQMLCTEYYL